MRLAGKTAVITGAASGMGREGALMFAREGANVVVADLDEAGAAQTVALVEADGGSAAAAGFDATSLDANEALAAFALDRYGQIDCAWANAGLPAPFRSIRDYDPDLMDRLLAVNVKGPWLLARACIDPLKATRGSFLVTASLSGLKARANHSGYQASKGAAVMLARSLSREFAEFGVRVNCLCPVAADTPMLPKFLDPGTDLMSVEELAAGVPLGRLASVSDVAQAALFFASDESAFLTGVILPVDGGVSA